jgi:FRG domain
METKPWFDEVRVVKCENFDDLTMKVRSTRWGLGRIFRGQREVTWPLSSLWERNLKFYRDGYHPPGSKPFWGEHKERNLDELFGPEGRINRNRFRDQFLEEFRDLVIGLPGVRSEVFTDKKYEKHAWALGRHHGLVTPLLDWTNSPYIALFFACFDYAEYHNPGLKSGLRGAGGGINFMDPQPIAIWELALGGTIVVEDEFEIFETRVDQAHRQKVQQGVFTYLNHHTCIDLESYLQSRNLARYLTRYELPGTEVGRAIWNLRLMNITYGTLFPDLEGAAIEANVGRAVRQLMHHYPLPTDSVPSEPA